jgi:hypothetical protein
MNTIDINKKVTALSVAHPAEAILLKACMAAIVLMLCGYVYVVSVTALNVMAGREADAQAASLEGSLGALQQRYYSLSHAISKETAAQMGLQPVAETAYVSRPSTVGIVYTADNAN